MSQSKSMTVSECECEFLEAQAAWKMSLTFDPFDSLAVVRSHNFWHGHQIVPNRIKP